jgi:chromosomal replication initiator protein
VSTPLWNQCLKYLQRELSAQDFNTWLRPLQVVEDEHALRLLAPNQFVLQWVQTHCHQQITRILTYLRPRQTPQLILQTGSHVTRPEVKTNGNPYTAAHVSYLNKKFTFDSFVAGNCNQFARNVSLEVAQVPNYNPLFIYGGVGLGKTHLMHAIGNHIVAQKNHAKVSYIRSEQFVNEMIKALRERRMDEFKNYYRSLDTLIIDDVQFFAQKNQSQEELFHTFNVLVENKKQIILAADKVPNSMNGIEDRLRSRFGWGLTVKIDTPDFETRLAILNDKADKVQLCLPYEVSHFIANRIQSNIRELEGALHRLAASSRFMRRTITLEMVQQSLQDLWTPHTQVTLEVIQKLVAEYFEISVADMRSEKRQRKIVRPRQMAMSLAKELTQHSLPEIGKAFGGRDHSTVIHSCKTITKLKTDDQQINQDYNKLLQNLSGNTLNTINL